MKMYLIWERPVRTDGAIRGPAAWCNTRAEARRERDRLVNAHPERSYAIEARPATRRLPQ